MNPYYPLMRVTNLEMYYVLRPELWNQRWRASEWERGRCDRLAGQPCRSASGPYLEGWYNQL